MLPVRGRRAFGIYRLPSPATGTVAAPRSRSATFRPVHIQVHGVDSPIWCVSRPLHISNNGLTAFMDVDVFDRDLLLSFAPMAVQCFEQSCILFA